MNLRSILAIIVGAASLAGPAAAAVVTTFSFSGQATSGQATGATNAFPANGVMRVEDPSFNYAAVIGQGTENPFLYAAGVASAGKSSASSNVLVTLQITNDTGDSAVGSLAGLIFPGAVGIANPDFTQASCTTAAIEACGSFLDGATPLHNGEFAKVDYSAVLNGVTIFGGSMSVSNAGMSSSFAGVSLNGFGVNPANGNLFTWQETTFSGLSLGTFAPGETKTLSFLVAASVATNGQFGCRGAPFTCPLALAGFGDPPPGNGGVIIGGGGGGSLARTDVTSLAAATIPSGSGGLVIKPFSGFTPTLTVNFGPTTPSEVPIPGAIWLFGLGLGGLRLSRLRRAKT